MQKFPSNKLLNTNPSSKYTQDIKAIQFITTTNGDEVKLMVPHICYHK